MTTFKFVAKNRQTERSGSVTVKAACERSARTKLELGGYEVISLVRVSNGQEATLKFHNHDVTNATPQVQNSGSMSKIRALITRFEYYVAYGA